MAAEHIPCDYTWWHISYGCWCGITIPFPSPWKPIDTFDAACKTHDYCYQDTQDNDTLDCDILDEYVWNYKWDTVDGEVNTVI